MYFYSIANIDIASKKEKKVSSDDNIIELL